MAATGLLRNAALFSGSAPDAFRDIWDYLAHARVTKPVRPVFLRGVAIVRDGILPCLSLCALLGCLFFFGMCNFSQTRSHALQLCVRWMLGWRWRIAHTTLG